MNLHINKEEFKDLCLLTSEYIGIPEDAIIKVIREQESLLTEFDDKIFNALIDRSEVLESTHCS